MQPWRKWAGLGAAAGLAVALAPVMQGSGLLDNPLGRARSSLPSFDGLDPARLDVRPHRVTAPLSDGRTAELTLDAAVQRAARTQMRRYQVPEAGVVMLEAKTGRVLTYASYVKRGTPFDVNARAEAPAASVFKVVTAAALVERGGLSSETEQCYRGGKSRIDADELYENPRLDKWCATLGIAMGRSINTVFARLALKYLTPEDLTRTGGAFGFGTPVPFVLPNQPPRIRIPDDELAFARTSAGFWNTSLSPLAAASIAQTVANGGVTLKPRMVSAVYRGKEALWKDERPPITVRRAVSAKTAAELTRMMVQTVNSGSASKSFRDERGRAYLPNITVAGKTGTLTDHQRNRHYTWFIGFAPAENPEVALLKHPLI
jgi:cell division protein FtsI/penicillin-binding protein 2